MQKTILVIAPDSEYLSQITAYWHDRPWRTITTPTLEEAIDILNDTDIDMIIATEKLSWLSGSEFLRLTHQRYPKMFRILIADDPSSTWDMRGPTYFHAESPIHFATSHPCDSECVTQAVYDMFGMEEPKFRRKILLRALT